MTDEPCEHEWRDDRLALDGAPIKQCIRCPRWKLALTPPFRRHRDPENTRRSMEETSRYLGEHRDV